MKKHRSVVTTIRLPKEDLLVYRLMAHAEGKSFPVWLEDILRIYLYHRSRKEATGL
jgi:hypothetical protein